MYGLYKPSFSNSDLMKRDLVYSANDQSQFLSGLH